MIQRESVRQEVPRVEHLKVENFRALRKVEFHDLTPMTVLLGPNGSGKSTVFDAFSFLGECFEVGLRNAWDRRGRAKELKTRDSQGPIVVEIKYRERPGTRLITYHLEVDEDGGLPIVEREWLAWKVGRWGGRFHFLDYGGGKGEAISGETPAAEGERRTIVLNSPDLLAANVLGQMQEHPRIAALRDFITGWRVSYPSADNTRDQPEAGPQEKLSSTGDNLADVILYLSERHSTRLEKIIETLRRRVPRVECVLTETMPDGRLSLKIKDAPFGSPVLARFASDGTLKMLAYLVLLHDPDPPPFIGVEEPENFLHPRLLFELAEECRVVCERTQILVATHSPFFVDSLRAEEVRVLWRDEAGHTQTQRLADLNRVAAFMKKGANLGDLWMEGYFGVGDPLVRQGGPVRLENKLNE